MNEIIDNLEEAEKLLKTEAFMECCAAERCEECVTIALTLSKQQPPASEFTKNIRDVLKVMGEDGKFHRKIMEEACARLDSADAELKRLQISWANENGLKEVAYQKRVELEADKAELVEACEYSHTYILRKIGQATHAVALLEAAIAKHQSKQSVEGKRE